MIQKMLPGGAQPWCRLSKRSSEVELPPTIAKLDMDGRWFIGRSILTSDGPLRPGRPVDEGLANRSEKTVNDGEWVT